MDISSNAKNFLFQEIRKDGSRKGKTNITDGGQVNVNCIACTRVIRKTDRQAGGQEGRPTDRQTN